MSTANPEYTITVDSTGVDIRWQGQTFTVDPEDLVGGGWEHDSACDRSHCGDGDCAPCPWCDGSGNLPTGAEALKRWHDEQGHHGPLWLCYEEPCKSVAEAIGAWGVPA